MPSGLVSYALAMMQDLICLSPLVSLFGGSIRKSSKTTKATNPVIRPQPSKSTVIFEARGVRYVAFESIAFEPTVPLFPAPSPVTVIENKQGAPITKEWLQGLIATLDNCDVYDSKSFLTGVIFTTPRGGQTVPLDCREYLKGLGNEWVEVRVVDQDGLSLVSGPYYYVGKALKSVCRLHDDEQGAFLSTIKPRLERSGGRDMKFQQLEAAGSLYDCLAVAVPPRAHTFVAKSQQQLRVAVKDCYFLRGLKTSLCNRDYYEMSDPAPYTAEVVHVLVKNGAHVLGLTKLSSMVAREEPLDAVDYPTAFNPRGDGYQSPAGSSSGSAVAVAAYDWIDCALGTDTSGSGRRPAMVNGVWQFRPSHSFVSRSGLVRTYDKFDTPCLFARSLDIIQQVMKLWLPPPSLRLSQPSKRPYKLIYPMEYLPVRNRHQMKLVDSLIEDMENLLHARVTLFSIRDSWKQSPPSCVSEGVDEYLDDVIRRTYYYQFYLSTVDFRRSYTDKYGRPPYVIPFVHDRWDQGARVSPAEYEEATKRLKIYKGWLHAQLFGDENMETLVILPVANAEPNYRDEPSPSPKQQSALDQLFLPPILGAPDIVIPIGDVPYKSKISCRDEFLPVVVNLVGAPEHDFQLLQAVETIMEKSSRPKVVSTGPRIFPR
ncbi:hypothetical protein FDECE_4131 [Fusarium decemcellulare]|nr:hypothetical protein FDECE_4131 [Fusarium decemcellulare]